MYWCIGFDVYIGLVECECCLQGVCVEVCYGQAEVSLVIGINGGIQCIVLVCRFLVLNGVLTM